MSSGTSALASCPTSMASPIAEKAVPSQESPCSVFSTVGQPDPKPPDDRADPGILDPCSTLLLQMFMEELDSANGLLGEEEQHEGDTPSCPVPSPSTPPLPLNQVPVTMESPNLTGLDDPFLMEFTDIDMLIQDTNLINSISDNTPPTPSDNAPSPVDSNSPFLIPSECVSLSVDSSPPSFSVPSSPDKNNDLTVAFSGDILVDYPEHSTTQPVSSEAAQVANPSVSPDDVEPSRKRQASDEIEVTTGELVSKKPKPIVKNEKYYERRHKNNLASQVSRAKRRAKRASMFGRVDELEQENEQLRARVDEMTAEAARLKKLLIDRLAQ